MMHPLYYVNLGTTVMCLVFVVMIVIAYYSKKNMNNIENRIYRRLLWFTLFALIYAILINFVFKQDNSSFFFLLFKFSFLATTCWLLFFLFYIYVICHEYKESTYNFLCNKFTLIKNGIYFFLFLLYLLLLSFKNDKFIFKDGVMVAAEGSSSTLYSILLIIIIISIFVIFAVNKKHTSKKKLVPFYLIMPVGIVCFILMFLLPNLGTVQILFSVVLYIMFHTIENPDVKMVNELTLARDQAEKASHAKSEFLSSMSHELRTPLNAIIGLTDVAVESNDIEEMKSDMRDIKVSSMKLLELVDGILLSNNIDNNSLEINNSNYNINELLDSVINKNKILLSEKNVEFKTRIDNLPNILYGDKSKIKTIIDNVLSNAIKYTDDGYILLDVSGLNNKDKFNLKITITDTGKGISDEEVTKIFDKFYRNEDNKNSDIEGTGLGLSITKSLVELMDGKITVNSNEGEGTTFTITLVQGLVQENDNVETL